MSNYLRKRNEQNLFDDSFSFKDFFQMPFLKQDNFLKTDIIDNSTSYTLLVDIPGCDKNEVKIVNEDGYLTVEVTNNIENERTSENYLKKERVHGSYSRSYYIGKGIESKDIEASFKNGVLKITFPKEKEDKTTTYIPIKEK